MTYGDYIPVTDCLRIEGDNIIPENTYYQLSQSFLGEEAVYRFMKVTDQNSLLDFCRCRSSYSYKKSLDNTYDTDLLTNWDSINTQCTTFGSANPLKDFCKKTNTEFKQTTFYLFPSTSPNSQQETLSDIVAYAKLMNWLTTIYRMLLGQTERDEGLIPSITVIKLCNLLTQDNTAEILSSNLEEIASPDMTVRNLAVDLLNSIARVMCAQVYQAPFFDDDGNAIWRSYTKAYIPGLFNEFFFNLSRNQLHAKRCDFCGRYFFTSKNNKKYCSTAHKKSSDSRRFRNSLEKTLGKSPRGRRPLVKANSKEVLQDEG